MSARELEIIEELRDREFAPRESTQAVLNALDYTEDTGEKIDWAEGQQEILDAILNRSAPDGRKRVQVIAATRYGKSLAVGAGVATRASSKTEPWAIIAGTKEKARIIMEYVIMFALNNPIIRQQLHPKTPLDRLRMKKSQDRLVFRKGGEVRVFTAEANRVTETSKSLMGFGSPNVVEDESALIDDRLQATVLRMLGDKTDNFMIKIGNPFKRNHFLKTWLDGNYHRIFIDDKRALEEGRFTEEFLDEMRDQAMYDILYQCRFPPADAIDEKGWTPLLTETDIKNAMISAETTPFGVRRLGVDIAGEGRNKSVIVERGRNVAEILHEERTSDSTNLAAKVHKTKTDRNVEPRDIFIDKIGIGKGLYDILRQSNPYFVGVQGSESPTDPTFKNKRAEMYWRLRKWIQSGGKLKEHPDWYQLANIKYKVEDGSGKVKIMSKYEMLREGIDSPDVADALSLTFAKPETLAADRMAEQQGRQSSTTVTHDHPLDPY